ncbi:DNA-binding CsgD family transcriptional regulator/PAS domain-containing protein [Caulobacter ginsengisoli]|uniref:DNA-binding CsgD family transcriptional regulator/PAS domain-containing protein n=1 Tax=Caulobacter ginsengisoli TaxID=400775 RepID=A0ABU0IPN1_9CAUL|nr:hypothetical protein [Caulobacter ginsengisoli]MDQ0463968.1 DNA-binding CsgD family transcriptional regulator/PAS domain-containing protein [Caulobacter ginsengisoli]
MGDQLRKRGIAMTAIDDTRVLGLVDEIYQAAADFDLWPRVLTSIADACGAQDASLGAMAPHGIPWIFAPRTDPDFMRRYGDYHADDHVWHGVTRRGVGSAATDAMVLPRENLQRSAFHNEWSRPQGYRTVMGCMVLAEQGWRSVLMLPGREDFEPEALRLLQALTPHLERAVRLNIRLALGQGGEGLTSQLLQRLEAAALLVDAEGRVLFANPAAEALFRGGRGLRLAQGSLTAERSADAERLRALIAGCAAGDGLDQAGGVVRIDNISGRPLILQVSAVRRPTPIIWAGQPAAIILDAGRQAPLGAADRLRLTYGLTPAEAAFALEIAKGDGKPAAARRSGIAYATARTHLSHIFDKTGVHRQAELVRLVLDEEGRAL